MVSSSIISKLINNVQKKFTYVLFLKHFFRLNTYPNLGLSNIKVLLMYRISQTVCVPMPTHCTITCFGFRARRIDGVECGIFSILAPLGQTILRVGRVSVIVYWRKLGQDDCMCNCLCSVIVLCAMMMKGREKVKLGAGSQPALLEKHQGGRQA